MQMDEIFLLRFMESIILSIFIGKYLSKKYIDDSPHWGEMKPEIWEGYMDFMKENGLIEEIVPAQMCFTNEFLPYNDSK